MLFPSHYIAPGNMRRVVKLRAKGMSYSQASTEVQHDVCGAWQNLQAWVLKLVPQKVISTRSGAWLSPLSGLTSRGPLNLASSHSYIIGKDPLVDHQSRFLLRPLRLLVYTFPHRTGTVGPPLVCPSLQRRTFSQLVLPGYLP
jgi:hypothetical protein